MIVSVLNLKKFKLVTAIFFVVTFVILLSTFRSKPFVDVLLWISFALYGFTSALKLFYVGELKVVDNDVSL